MRRLSKAGRTLLSLFAVLTVAVCSEPLATRAGPAIPLAIRAAVAGDGANDAYAKSDQIRVGVFTSDEVEVAETTLPFEPSGAAPVPVRLEISSDYTGQQLSVEVDLLSGGAPIFAGAGRATPQFGSPAAVDIFLNPVVFAVDAPTDAGPITAIGSSLQLSASPVFATGDPVPNIGITWTTLDPNVVDVSPTGVVTALAEGIGRVRASSGSASATVRVSVEAQVVTVDISPPQASVTVNQTVEFDFVPRDANGTVLAGRSATWESSDPGILAVVAPGVALGVQAGEAEMIATVEGVEGSAQVTVTEILPATPTNFGGSVNGMDVLLTWVDNASNETRYEVLRTVGGTSPSGDATEGIGVEEIVAVLPANTTVYTDVTNAADQYLEYRVRACNDFGCAPSDVVSFTTVPRTPFDLRVVLVVDALENYSYVLVWSDISNYTDEYLVQAYDFDFELFELMTPATKPCPSGWAKPEQPPCHDLGPDPIAIYYTFRVSACNEAGCSDYVEYVGGAPEPSLPLSTPNSVEDSDQEPSDHDEPQTVEPSGSRTWSR